MKPPAQERLPFLFSVGSTAPIIFLTLLAATAAAQTSMQVGELTTPAGQVRSGYLSVPPGPDGETRIPITVFHGTGRGPILGLVAGNHGYEYTPILAAQRLLHSIDPSRLRGSVLLVHIANLPSFQRRTVYYGPSDWKNLNRVYPGKADGTLSERIAYVITREIIERSDYLVDLHCGDGNESLRPYSYWMPIGNPAVDEPSKAMALAFGLDHIVVDRNRPRDPALSQFCSSTAMTRGKPAITIESGGMGQAFEEEAIRRIEQGVLNLLRHFKIEDGKVEPVRNPTWLDPTEVLRFPEDLTEKVGLFFPKVKSGSTVGRNELLGEITDVFGRKIFEVRSPFAGQLLYILGTPPVSAGEPLAFVGVPKSAP